MFLLNVFSRDQQILQRNGRDAIQYLSFQRYIIAYVALLTFISLVVVLPVNFQGTLGKFPLVVSFGCQFIIEFY